MQIEREIIDLGENSSFKLFEPSFKDYFLWHYHPEIELAYVEAESGIRHIGQDVSNYAESELVLIGPNIPHLNFDYAVQSEYKQIVIQFKTGFLGFPNSAIPELTSIQSLFEKSSFGISFSGETKLPAKKALLEIQGLSGTAQF